MCGVCGKIPLERSTHSKKNKKTYNLYKCQYSKVISRWEREFTRSFEDRTFWDSSMILVTYETNLLQRASACHVQPLSIGNAHRSAHPPEKLHLSAWRMAIITNFISSQSAGQSSFPPIFLLLCLVITVTFLFQSWSLHSFTMVSVRNAFADANGAATRWKTHLNRVKWQMQSWFRNRFLW